MSITGPGSITALNLAAQTGMFKELNTLAQELGSGQAAQTYSGLGSQAGLVTALVSYWINVRAADPLLDDTTALGYTRSMQHQMGAMMGHFGVMLTGWQEALSSPLGEALLILACAALLAGYFFRVAWVSEQEERG